MDVAFSHSLGHKRTPGNQAIICYQVKILIMLLLCGILHSSYSTIMNNDELKSFGIEYEAAWRSLVPENPFSYQAKECIVTVNDGEPMITAEGRLGGIIGFMEAFPDLLITMRDIVEEDRGTVFYWNLKGTTRLKESVDAGGIVGRLCFASERGRHVAFGSPDGIKHCTGKDKVRLDF